MLQALELTKKYGEQVALNGLNLEIPSGEVFCLLGANGAGKSTTIKLFLNFITPTSGSVLINGIDPSQNGSETRSLLGYIPEQVALYPRLSGIENLRYFASLSGEQELSRNRLIEAMTRAGLPDAALDKRVVNYSKGMRQKVVIALALVRSIRGLLLDEPTSGLDPQAANEFTKIMRRLADEGVAILMASHDLHHARESSTRIGIMCQGELVETLPAKELTHAELMDRALVRMQ